MPWAGSLLQAGLAADQGAGADQARRKESTSTLLVDLMLAIWRSSLEIREQYKDIYIGAH